MTDTDIFSALKEVRKVMEERDRLKVIVSNYQEIANKLNNIATELKGLSRELDPFVLNSGASSSSNGEHKIYTPRQSMKAIYQEFLDVMQSGIHVSRDLVQKTYPEFDATKISNIMQRLQTYPKVQKRKDGRIVYLYM